MADIKGAAAEGPAGGKGIGSTVGATAFLPNHHPPPNASTTAKPSHHPMRFRFIAHLIQSFGSLYTI